MRVSLGRNLGALWFLMPIPNWVASLLWYTCRPLLLAGAVSLCLALPLSLATPRQRPIARLLWPVGALLLWSGICAFTGWAAATDHDNAIYGMGIERLALPTVLWALGSALGCLWLRSAIRVSREWPV